MSGLTVEVPSLSPQPSTQQSLTTDQQDLKAIVKAAVVEVIGANLHQEVYTRREAAVFLRMKVSTLDKLVKRQLIFPNTATRNPSYSREELLRFQRDNTTKLD